MIHREQRAAARPSLIEYGRSRRCPARTSRILGRVDHADRDRARQPHLCTRRRGSACGDRPSRGRRGCPDGVSGGPAAREAGIRTPRLLAFDDSRTLVDRPFSIWERVHGKTVGSAGFDARQRTTVWYAIGQEIAQLHSRVRVCPDPLGYLDAPGYELNLGPTVARLVDAGAASRQLAPEISRLLDELTPYMSGADHERCFVHNDLHEMNVMCTPAGALLALIDWGDAGWGDPALDLVAAPLAMMPAAIDGYGRANRHRLGSCPEARIIWAKLHRAMDHAIDRPGTAIPLTSFRRFLDHR